MKILEICLLLLCLRLAVISAASASSLWSYNKDLENGPDNWRKNFPQCAGYRQSPIDIPSSQTIMHRGLGSIVFDQNLARNFVVEKNDHAIEILLEDDIYVRSGGLRNTYKTKQLHFHWGLDNSYGSEHSLNGKFFPLELHIVNWNSDKYRSFDEAKTQPDGLAVLGIWFQESWNDNPLLRDVIDAVQVMTFEGRQNQKAIPAFSFQSLLPAENPRYFRYHGSLTTPGCFESVTWTVFEQSQPISSRQLQVLRQLLTHENSLSHANIRTQTNEQHMGNNNILGVSPNNWGNGENRNGNWGSSRANQWRQEGANQWGQDGANQRGQEGANQWGQAGANQRRQEGANQWGQEGANQWRQGGANQWVQKGANQWRQEGANQWGQEMTRQQERNKNARDFTSGRHWRSEGTNNQNVRNNIQQEEQLGEQTISNNNERGFSRDRQGGQQFGRQLERSNNFGGEFQRTRQRRFESDRRRFRRQARRGMTTIVINNCRPTQPLNGRYVYRNM